MAVTIQSQIDAVGLYGDNGSLEGLLRRRAVSFARTQAWGRGARGLVAVRCTGTAGRGGIWQCYVSARGGGLTSRGPNLHVDSSGVVQAVP
jgi:hypothetical protein